MLKNRYKSRIIEIEGKKVKIGVAEHFDLDVFEEKVKRGISIGITKEYEKKDDKVIKFFYVL